MTFSYDACKKILEEDREYTQKMVDNEEITEEEGCFRDLMRKDEILDMFD